MPTETLETLFALASAYAKTTRALEVHGLSFSELRLLLALRAGPDQGSRPTDIARDLNVTASGITRALLPLEKRGIVSRERDPGDGRASRALLTPAGHRILSEALIIAAERAGKLLRRLSVGQARQLERLLGEIGN
jgi:DNA-binding MarR family transcriptional regulator